MAKFIKHYEILLNKAKVDLKAAQNLYKDIQDGEEGLDSDLLNGLSDYAVEGRYLFIHEDIKEIEKYFKMLSLALSKPLF